MRRVRCRGCHRLFAPMTSLHIMLADPPNIRVQKGGRYSAHLVPWLRYSQRGRENSGKRKDCMGAAYDRLSTGLRWQVIYIYIYIYMHIYAYICLAPLLARGMPGSNTNTTLCARNSVCLQDDFYLCRLTQMAGAQRTCALQRRDTQRVVRGGCMFCLCLISCRPRSLHPSTGRCSALCLRWWCCCGTSAPWGGARGMTCGPAIMMQVCVHNLVLNWSFHRVLLCA